MVRWRAAQGLLGVTFAGIGVALFLSVAHAWAGLALAGILLFTEAAFGRWGDEG